ncbi:MAG: type V CRISPR-associated protein Cas12a/Cpf1 [Bacteroidales bacterium]|nr:type V CRISPR-associated protein Cas12a/Cpf1 [Bacteroidales bacterium]MDY4932524.1 type V CRISPR-associated protein Cas12a/Cpf1 [Candidatus Onthomorpha sp.]
MNEFIHLYPLSKTLRFELRPVGKTEEMFRKSGILEQDNGRADSYKVVKKLIDRYHKDFIEKALQGFEFEEGSLEKYYKLYSTANRDEKEENDFEKAKESLRKQITKQLTKQEAYKRIDKKELIKEDLCKAIECSEEEKKAIEEFNDFTTYFRGFHENRKNMYSDKEQSTAIAFRLIHQNLPKFLDNIKTFEKIKGIEELQDKIQVLQTEFDCNIEQMFTLEYYNHLVLQSGIEQYNAIVGGVSKQDGEKVQGLNELINLYNQTHKDQRLPKMQLLYKQILSDRQSLSWLPEEFTEDDNLVLQTIEDFCQKLQNEKTNEGGSVLQQIKTILASLSSYNLEGVYLTNDQQLTDISQRLYGSWAVVKYAILADLQRQSPQKNKESNEKYDERITKLFNSYKSFSIDYIDRCLQHEEAFGDKAIMIETYFENLGKKTGENETEESKNIFEQIEDAYNDAKELLQSEYPADKKLSEDESSVEKIKTLLDSFKTLQHFIKPLSGSGEESTKDERFYSDYSVLKDSLDIITPLYNKVRNYMTRRSYSNDKIKLNFGNATLCDGWDKNKETDNTAVILRKDGLYYLAIMNKQYNRSFALDNLPCEGECYEKVVYKLLPGANKMLPKVFLSEKGIAKYTPSEQLLQNYKKGTHKKGDNFNLQDCHELIDFFKASINKHEDWKNFDFHFSDTSSYEDISGFYREVENQGYKINFQKVSTQYIDNLVNEGKLYLFQIYNKDFSTKSHGTENMHTLYWRMLFDERNLQDVVYKLNGEAEVFFRKKSLNVTKPTHPANQPIENKNPLNPSKTRTLCYDLIKDRRFTQDKFLFHVPITINFKSQGRDNINQLTREYLCSANDVHIIGIDRGERNLLYLTVIDSKGNIKEQMSLNKIINQYNINGCENTYEFDYHKRLDQKETERQQARQNWKTIENIKELKEGYLSQVIHIITKLMLKYNAIIVLEDLNHGFMRGRQKIEKQVYQKFEKMLIDKLNYLADKKKDPCEIGGILNAYQLTSKFESFEKLGKQSGFLFYVPAWNTSKIDPTTGFVNLFDTRYKNIVAAGEFFGSFDCISYNKDKDWFEFSFDYNKFTKKAEGTKTQWTICTYGDRIEYEGKEYKRIKLTEAFKQLFDEYKIDINSDLQKSICTSDNKNFFEKLLHLLRLTLQMRNSISNTDEDYIISPVMNSKGEFYDSRKASDNLPKDADANGAYNIARKGLMLLQQMQQMQSLEKPKYDLTNKAWLQFAQQDK